MANFAISLGINIGISLLTSLLTPPIEGPRLNDLNAPKSAYGAVIPSVWGTVRVGANTVAAADIVERQSGGKGVFGPKTNQYTYYGSFAALVCEGPILAIKKIWLNGKIYYNLGHDADAKTIADSKQFLARYGRLYLGSATQQTDAWLETLNDSLNAYRHRAYLVFENLPLADFGNTFPAISVEVVTAGTIDTAGLITPSKVPLAAIISDLCLRSGLNPAQIDVTDIESILCTGYYTGDSAAAYKTFIDALQQAYLIDAVESGGVIKFQSAKRPTIAASIPLEKMAAFQSGTTKPDYIKTTRTQDLELPQSVQFKALNPALNYAEDSRKAIRHTSKINQNAKQFAFSGVMSATEITTIAYKQLHLAWIERFTYDFYLPPEYLYLEAGDIIELPSFGNNSGGTLVKLTKINLGTSLLVECKAKAYEPSIYDFIARILPEFKETVTDADGNNEYQLRRRNLESILQITNESGTVTYSPDTDWSADLSTGKITRNPNGAIAEQQALSVRYESEETESPPDTVDVSGDSILRVLDINLIKDSDPQFGLYVAIASTSGRWQPTTLHYSADNGVTYTAVKTFTTPSVLGTCKTILGATSTTLQVEVASGSLSSIPQNPRQLNWEIALVGEEIIRFKNANKISANTYELSDFQRGVRGTEWAIEAHATDEKFTLLTDIYRLEGSVYDLGQTLYFKATSGGLLYQTLEDTNPVIKTVQGAALKPYAPVNLQGTRDFDGNLALTWTRRDRLRGDATDFNNLPLSEQFERYEVDIMDGNAVKRTLSNISTASAYYSIFDQTTDWGVAQSGVDLKIFQISADVGRGYQAEATL
jgi:hypothetical protein